MNKATFSIKFKLLLITLLPVVILCLILTLIAAKNIRAGMQDEALQGLKGMAYSFEEIYLMVAEGEFTLEEDGTLKKGEYVITDNYQIVDDIKATSGYDVTLFFGDTRMVTSLSDHKTGERLIGTKASETVIETVLKNGKEYSDTNVVINETPYYAYYVPIKQNDEIIGMAFAGIESTEMDEFIETKVKTIIGVAVASLIFMLIIILLFSIQLGGTIAGLEHVVVDIQQGNLTTTVHEKAKKRNDELGSIARALEALIMELSEIIGSVKQSSKVLFDSGHSLEEMANQTSGTTHEISSAVEDVSRGAMTQAEETESASASIADMGQIITDIVSSVDALMIASENMKNASDESAEIIHELSISNDRTTEAIKKIGEQVNTTNESVQEIGKAVAMITSIATETNLLSLNASIEAARAGEHGRGFAVVASQIQKLAEESNKSAAEIRTIIDNLLQDSEQTVRVMSEVHVIVDEQRTKLRQTQDKFNMVTSGVNSTTNETRVIERHASAVDEARAKIMDVIQNLSAISEENAASTQETNASMEELNATLNVLAENAADLLAISSELDQSMEYFQL